MGHTSEHLGRQQQGPPAKRDHSPLLEIRLLPSEVTDGPRGTPVRIGSKCASISKTRPNFRRGIIFLSPAQSSEDSSAVTPTQRLATEAPTEEEEEQGRVAEGWQECVLCPASLDLLPTYPQSLGLEAHSPPSSSAAHRGSWERQGVK